MNKQRGDVAVKLQQDAALSTEEVDELPPGQAHWWLRKESDFVRLPKRVRGDEPLDLVVQLEPGEYILGVGPPRSGVRIEIEVAPQLATGSGETPRPVASDAAKSIDVKGKSFVITGDLDSLDREAAKAWLVGLGAKVTSSVSGNTDYLLVGREPGQKKLEKAAELGTTIISEADLRAALGDAPPAAAPATAKPKAKASPNDKVAKILTALNPRDKEPIPAIEAIMGPKHFADLGLTDSELWGIAIGPRGGHYSVHIDLDDRPQYGVRCSCKDYNPCKHAYALLFTAQRDFVPPVPAPDGHKEAARYRPGWE